MHFYLDDSGQFTLKPAQAGTLSTLMPSSDGVFFNPDGPDVWRFEKDESGVVTHVILEAGGGEFRYKSTPPPPTPIVVAPEILERYEGKYVGKRLVGAERGNESFDNWEAMIYLDDAGEFWLHFDNQPRLFMRPVSEKEFFVPGFIGNVEFTVDEGETQAKQFVMKWPVGDVVFKRVDSP
jgi:hypothetical protein